jgi:hypothetical protein
MKTFIGTLILSIVGLILMIGAILKIVGNIFFLRLSQKATGTVVNLKMAQGGTRSRHKVYLPVVEFEPVVNHKIRIDATVGANPPDYQIGDLVTVRFLPKRPGGGKIQSFWEMWFVPVVCFAVGSIVSAMAFLLFLN